MPTIGKSSCEELGRWRRPTWAPAASPEVLQVRLLGLLQPLEPLVAWLLHRQATADLRRLKHLLETPPLISGSAPEETAT
jgi:hypothetical protein